MREEREQRDKRKIKMSQFLHKGTQTLANHIMFSISYFPRNCDDRTPQGNGSRWLIFLRHPRSKTIGS